MSEITKQADEFVKQMINEELVESSTLEYAVSLIQALHAENELLQKEIADYGFYGALERAEAPLKETITSLEAEKQRLITNHFGQSQKAWEQRCKDVTEARELGYQAGIEVITLHTQTELAAVRADAERMAKFIYYLDRYMPICETANKYLP